MGKWTLKGLQYHAPGAKRLVLTIHLHCRKVNNVFIQNEFNFYLIYIYIAEAFLATLSKSAYPEDVYWNKLERQFPRL